MKLAAVILGFCFVFGMAVSPGAASRNIPRGLNGYDGPVVLRGGARGLGDDVIRVAMIPIHFLESVIKVPIKILEGIGETLNRFLRQILPARVVDAIEVFVSIRRFPTKFTWFVFTLPGRIFWSLIGRPVTTMLTSFLNFVGNSVTMVWNSLFGHNHPHQVNYVNGFLKGDVFGPLGRSIEGLVREVINVIYSINDWFFDSNPENVVMRRQQVVKTVSRALVNIGRASQMLRREQ